MIVTITCKEGRKIVDQFDVDVPKFVKWIAQDEDGETVGYRDKPVLNPATNWWKRSNNVSINMTILVSVLSNPDWKDSLIKVGDIK